MDSISFNPHSTIEVDIIIIIIIIYSHFTDEKLGHGESKQPSQGYIYVSMCAGVEIPKAHLYMCFKRIAFLLFLTKRKKKKCDITISLPFIYLLGNY